VGKTSLALVAAAGLQAAFSGGVTWVPLASLADAVLLPTAVAHALGLMDTGASRAVEAIRAALDAQPTLLVLDNLEHLAPAARDVATLLNLVPDLDVLTTSRAPLRLSGEHVLPLDPLPVDDAATLFVELAAARGVVLREDAVPSVREICRRLDGLPLAIELVAARLVVLPPAQILRALDEGLALEMEGPIDLPERQRTLRTTIAWSYGLLSESQRELHDALAVFAGGCTFDDARAVARAGSGFFRDLESLVAWSLVRSDVTDGDVRLSMLETVREDAVARLVEGGRLDALRRPHAERFLELARAAEDELAGPNQADWLERLEQELDNIRAALDWCLSSKRVEAALRAMSALERFWRAHGHLAEARRWLSQGLARADGLPAEVRARALWTAAHVAMMQSDYRAAIPALEESLRLFRELHDDRYSVFALCELARALSSQDELDKAQRAGEEALSIAEKAGDERASSAALDTLAMIAGYRGQRDQAQALSERGLGLRRALGDPMLIAHSANTLGLEAMRAGDLDTAERAFEECLQLARELGEKVLTAAALCALGEIALGREIPWVAAQRLLEALKLYRELGDERDCAECLHALGGVAAALELYVTAGRLWGGAAALRERPGAALNPEEKAVDQRFCSAVIAELGAEQLAEARAEGRALGLAELEIIVVELGAAALIE
jgi:predicted ATPase